MWGFGVIECVLSLLTARAVVRLCGCEYWHRWFRQKWQRHRRHITAVWNTNFPLSLCSLIVRQFNKPARVFIRLVEWLMQTDFSPLASNRRNHRFTLMLLWRARIVSATRINETIYRANGTITERTVKTCYLMSTSFGLHRTNLICQHGDGNFVCGELDACDPIALLSRNVHRNPIVFDWAIEMLFNVYPNA